MSLGYAGHARLKLEDAEIAIYSYTGEDWNVQDESARKALESALDSSQSISPVSSNQRRTARLEKHPMAGRNSLKRRLLAILAFRG